MKTILLAVAALAATGLSCKTLKGGTSLGNVASDLDTASKVAGMIEDMTKDLSPENEYYVGRSVATNILAKHEYKYLGKERIQNGNLDRISGYVTKVGLVVAAAAMEAPRKGDRPVPIGGWHFVVVESDVINAFAAPGGYVFVTTAAVETATSEDELACVLAHEIAHVVRGHALGTIKKSRYANVSKDALKMTGALSSEQLGQLTELLEGAIDDMIDAFFVKGYSKDTEFEADKVGVEIVARAGYDPSAMNRYLDVLAKNQKTGSGGFYQTHPSAADRVKKITALLPKVGGAKKTPKVRSERFLEATAELR